MVIFHIEMDTVNVVTCLVSSNICSSTINAWHSSRIFLIWASRSFRAASYDRWSSSSWKFSSCICFSRSEFYKQLSTIKIVYPNCSIWHNAPMKVLTRPSRSESFPRRSPSWVRRRLTSSFWYPCSICWRADWVWISCTLSLYQDSMSLRLAFDSCSMHYYSYYLYNITVPTFMLALSPIYRFSIFHETFLHFLICQILKFNNQ